MTDHGCKAMYPLSPDLDLRCCGMDGHEPPHYYMRTWTEPAPDPVPEWRRLVEEFDDNPQSAYETALSCVLSTMSVIDDELTVADSVHDIGMSLARIVAVCEQQVGDGWRADPVDFKRPSAWWLAREFAYGAAGESPTEYDWRCLGNAAAGWLATLTGEAS